MTIRFSMLVAGWFLYGISSVSSVPLTQGHINPEERAAAVRDAGSLPLHLVQRRGWGGGGGFRAPMRAPTPRFSPNYNVAPRMAPPRMSPPPARIAPSPRFNQPSTIGRTGSTRFGAGTAPWRAGAPALGMPGRPSPATITSGPRFGLYHALGRPGQGGLYQRLYGASGSTAQRSWFYRAEHLSNPVPRSERITARVSAATAGPPIRTARTSSTVVDSAPSTRRVAASAAGGGRGRDGGGGSPPNRGWRGAAFTTNGGGTMVIGRVGQPANDAVASTAATARTQTQLVANQRARNATMAAAIALTPQNLLSGTTLPVRDWRVNSTVKAARLRADQMLKDNVGYNIRPAGDEGKYQTIGRQKTYITDKTFIDRVMALPRDKDGKLPRQATANIERELGLNPGSLEGGFTIRKIENVSARQPSPAEGGNYFYRGRYMQLPGGHPELTINPVNVNGPGVSEVARISVAVGPAP